MTFGNSMARLLTKAEVAMVQVLSREALTPAMAPPRRPVCVGRCVDSWKGGRPALARTKPQGWAGKSAQGRPFHWYGMR